MNLVIYGIGKLAEYVSFLFEHDSEYNVIGYTIEEEYVQGEAKQFLNDSLVVFENLKSVYPPEDYKLFIAVGNNTIRKRLFEKGKAMGYSLASYIYSETTKWHDLQIGENTFIGENSTIQPFCKIGNNSIFFGAKLGHHTEIADHCLLSHCVLGGNVKVADGTFIGMNSSIKHDVTIAENNIIGMHCNIASDTKPNQVYATKETELRNITADIIQNKYL